jgi:hypothetical protein
MELKIKITSSNVEEVKQIAKQLIEFQKEHSPYCTLSVEIEIN